MKLLFDQNLLHRLVVQIVELFPESQHVRNVGLETADDEAVWEFAVVGLLSRSIVIRSLGDGPGYRLLVVHGTHDVTVARNVGVLSTGHGYYVEDASEIDNLFCHNLAVSIQGSIREYLLAQAQEAQNDPSNRLSIRATLVQTNLFLPPRRKTKPLTLGGLRSG